MEEAFCLQPIDTNSFGTLELKDGIIQTSSFTNFFGPPGLKRGIFGTITSKNPFGPPVLKHGIVEKITFTKIDSSVVNNVEGGLGNLLVEVGESTEKERAWARRMLLLEQYPVTEKLLKVPRLTLS